MPFPDNCHDNSTTVQLCLRAKDKIFAYFVSVFFLKLPENKPRMMTEGLFIFPRDFLATVFEKRVSNFFLHAL